jgi:hypothetical protein
MLTPSVIPPAAGAVSLYWIEPTTASAGTGLARGKTRYAYQPPVPAVAMIWPIALVVMPVHAPPPVGTMLSP